MASVCHGRWSRASPRGPRPPPLSGTQGARSSWKAEEPRGEAPSQNLRRRGIQRTRHSHGPRGRHKDPPFDLVFPGVLSVGGRPPHVGSRTAAAREGSPLRGASARLTRSRPSTGRRAPEQKRERRLSLGLADSAARNRPPHGRAGGRGVRRQGPCGFCPPPGWFSAGRSLEEQNPGRCSSW